MSRNAINPPAPRVDRVYRVEVSTLPGMGPDDRPAEERQRGTVREQLAALEGDPQQQRIAASRRGADVLRSLRRAR